MKTIYLEVFNWVKYNLNTPTSLKLFHQITYSGEPASSTESTGKTLTSWGHIHGRKMIHTLIFQPITYNLIYIQNNSNAVKEASTKANTAWRNHSFSMKGGWDH